MYPSQPKSEFSKIELVISFPHLRKGFHYSLCMFKLQHEISQGHLNNVIVHEMSLTKPTGKTAFQNHDATLPFTVPTIPQRPRDDRASLEALSICMIYRTRGEERG